MFLFIEKYDDHDPITKVHCPSESMDKLGVFMIGLDRIKHATGDMHVSSKS